MNLLTDAGADTTGDGKSSNGRQEFFCFGTFNGATCKPQISHDGVSWFDITNETGDAMEFTANGVGRIKRSSTANYRGVITGGDGGTEISLVLA